MQTRRWLNQGLPQTLQIAVFLLYFTAFFGVVNLLRAGGLYGGVFGAVTLFIIAGAVLAGYGIANEKKWGWMLGIAVAGTQLLLYMYTVIVLGAPLFYDPISLMFDVALFALLVHPQSREHQRIWFT